MTFGLLSYLGGRVPITGSLNISVPSAPDTSNSFMTITPTGATVTTSGDYKILAYYGSGTMNVQSLGIDSVSGSTVEIMLVAGGGGGGRDMGGGGGAGGYYACTSFKVFQTEYTITVGSGGAGAVSDGTSSFWSGANRPGSNGTSSIITSPYGTLEAIGGGGGASRHNSETNKAGSGGSGGGASGQYGNHGRALRGDMGYPGCPSGGIWYPGGGGGAGSRGMHGGETAIANGPGITNNNAPNGGKGVLNSILGPAYWWCGGGGGGGYSTYGGNGGVGGGGGGGQANIAGNYGLGGGNAINSGSNGTQASPIGTSTGPGYSGGNAGQYTGSGGGGTSHLTDNAANGPTTVSGNGGSGVVVIKYKFQ